MKFRGFSKKQLLDIFRNMKLSRYLDDKQLILLKQGKGFFHIGSSGHEAAGIAAALSFKPGFDYAYPYYRDQAFCLGWGMSSREHLLSFLAKEVFFKIWFMPSIILNSALSFAFASK